MTHRPRSTIDEEREKEEKNKTKKPIITKNMLWTSLSFYKIVERSRSEDVNSSFWVVNIFLQLDYNRLGTLKKK